MFSLETERDRQALEHAAAFRKGLTCGVCRDFLRDAHNLPCGHNFCLECINAALAKINTCPNCGNPAWHKDTLKAAQADSAVDDWKDKCEEQFKAIVKRQAAAEEEEEGGETEEGEEEDSGGDTDAGDCPSRDGRCDSTDLAEDTVNEDKVGKKKSVVEKGEDKQSAPGTLAHAFSPRENCSTVAAEALSKAVPGLPGKAGVLLIGTGDTHGLFKATATETVGAVASLKEAIMVDEHLLRQNKENVVALPSFVKAPASPVARVGRAGRSPTGAGKPPRVHLQQQPQSPQPCGAQAPPGDGADGKKPRPSASHKVDAPSFPVKPPASPLAKGEASGVASGNGTTDGSTPPPPGGARAERRVLGSVVEEHRSHERRRSPDTPRAGTTPLVSSGAPEVAADKGGAACEFSGILPDTCDVVDVAGSPPRAATGGTGDVLIRTPPTLKGGAAVPEAGGGRPTKRAWVDARRPRVGASTPTCVGGGGGSGGGRGGDSGEAEGLFVETDGGFPLVNVPGCGSKGTGTDSSMIEARHREDGRQSSPAGQMRAGQSPELRLQPASKERVGKRDDGQAAPADCTTADGSRRGEDKGGVKRAGGSSGDVGESDAQGTGSDAAPVAECRTLLPAGATEGDAAASGSPLQDVGSAASDSEGTASDGESLPLFTVAARQEDDDWAHRESPPPPLSETARQFSREDPPAERDIYPERGHRAGGSATPDDVVGAPEELGEGEEGEEEGEEETCDEAEAEAGDAEVVGQSKGKACGTRPHDHEHCYAEPCPTVVVAEVGTAGGVSRLKPPLTTGSASGLPSHPPESFTQTVASHEMPIGKDTKGEEDQSSKDGGRLAPVELDQTPDHRGRTPGVRGDDTEAECLADPVGVRGELVVPEPKPEMSVKFSAERVEGGLCSASTSAGSYGLETLSKCSAAEPGTISVGGLGGGEVVDSMEILDLTAAATAQEETTPACGGASPRTELIAHPEREKAASEVRSKHNRQQHTSTDIGKDSPGFKVASSMQTCLGGTADEVPETMPPVLEGTQEKAWGGNAPEARAICLATQEPSRQDGFGSSIVTGEGRRKDDREEETERHVPETAEQSLATQEVPETAQAWSSSPGGYGDTASQQVGRMAVAVATAAAPVAESDSSASAVPETPRLQAGATQSMADEAVGTCDESEGVGKGAISPVARIRDDLSTSPPPAADDEVETIEPPCGRLASMGLIASCPPPLRGGGHQGDLLESSAPPTDPTPGRGGTKRAMDSATLPPSRPSGDPETAGKRLKLSPPAPAAKGTPFQSEVSGSAAVCERLSRDASEELTMAGQEHPPPVAPQGGDCSGGSDTVGKIEVGHDQDAAQDAWHFEGGDTFGGYCDYEYESAGDGSEGDHDGKASRPQPREPAPPAPPTGANAGQAGQWLTKPVANPYTEPSHLELHPDCDSPLGVAKPRGEEGREKQAGGRGTSFKAPSRVGLRRPSNESMGFGGPSHSSNARSWSRFGREGVDNIIREKNRAKSSNSILAAGRGHSCGEGDSADKSGSWSPYSLGPDTQIITALDAGLAARGAQGKGRTDASTVAAAAELDMPDAINLADEERETAAPESRRKRSTPTGDGRGTVFFTSKKRGLAASTSARESPQRALPGRSPVIVLLGGEEWELNRAKLLCEKLGQSRLYTALVWGATHVVVGSGLTLERNSSSISGGTGAGGGGNGVGNGVVGENDSRGVRHELVKHNAEGYLEAVMLGLWVLDFSWVEACLDSGKGAADSSMKRKSRHDEGVNGRSMSSPRASPREFELVGCLKNHPGCEPRRGRVARGVGVPGVFNELVFYFADAGSCEVEKDRLARLVKLGKGVLKANVKAKPAGGRGGWVNEPFGGASGSSDCDNDESEFDAPAVTGKRVVLVVMWDCPDGTISQELAGTATKESVQVAATAAVDQAWIVRSIEEGSPVPFDDHRLSRFLDILPSRKRALLEGGLQSPSSTAGARKPSEERAKRPGKGRLSIRPASSRQEVVLGVGKERHHGNLPPAMCIQQQQEERLMLNAQAAIDAAERVTKQAAAILPPALGAQGFEFTRLGGRKKGDAVGETGEKGAVTFTMENKAQADLKDALDKAGYLSLAGKGPDHSDHKLGEFWFDKVYDGFFLKRSESAIPEAERRGCPLNVIREVFDRHELIQNDAARSRLKNLPKEYSLWTKAGGGAGSAADDAVELL